MPLSLALITASLAVQAAPAAAAAGGLAVGGTIAVTRPAPTGRRPAPTAVFADAAETALLDAGFTVIPHPEHARQVATVAVTRTAHGAALAKGASNGPPLPMLGAGGGAGGGVSIALGSKVNVGQMVATELKLTITRRGETTPVWEGRAVTYQVSGTRGDDQAAVARKLTTALTRNFNGPSGLSISVP